MSTPPASSKEPDYDPRARRLNPAIAELIDAVDEHWDFMLSAEDHLERQGRLRMVRRVIDQILEQPEWLEADLQPGTVDDAACWLTPEQFAEEPAAPVFLDERPFDTPGTSSGRHFLYAEVGRASFLYEGEPINPWIGPMKHCGNWLHTLESHWVTAIETVNHAISDNLWKQLTPADDGWSDQEGARYFILCDPRGIIGGDNADRIASYADAGRAVEVAESLSGQVGIRLAVARERRRYSCRG